MAGLSMYKYRLVEMTLCFKCQMYWCDYVEHKLIYVFFLLLSNHCYVNDKAFNLSKITWTLFMESVINHEEFS